ncbi:unnamed protein product [Symbiodinium natans]|uniref:Uncharacterized protein n=1 Tax=Symbiodinium natans TaxID=878477 RepID=A0A812PY25_9DINO|nr:unnamed protein product [Symbiodinium natans]
MDLAELQARWLAFREVYLDVLETGGRARNLHSKRLDALEEAARPFRERRLERWNRLAMLREDHPRHRGKKAALAFERSLRPKAATRVAPCSVAGRKRPRGEFQRKTSREDRVAQRLAWLLLRWDRAHRKILRFEALDRQAAARLAARRRQKQAAAARAEARRRRIEEAAARSAEKASAKRRKEEQSSRWKWLNRKDITMEELLHFRNMGCHQEAEQEFAERTSPAHCAQSPLSLSFLLAGRGA